jgi:hypothetical protein
MQGSIEGTTGFFRPVSNVQEFPHCGPNNDHLLLSSLLETFAEAPADELNRKASVAGKYIARRSLAFPTLDI